MVEAETQGHDDLNGIVPLRRAMGVGRGAGQGGNPSQPGIVGERPFSQALLNPERAPSSGGTRRGRVPRV